MKEKTQLSHEVVGFQMLDFETSNSKSEVSKSNSWKITFFLNVLIYFIINTSQLLVTKKGFKLITISSD